MATNLTTGMLADLLRERDCGFSYGGDPTRLAAQLTELRNDPKHLRRMRENAAAVFEEHFRADKVYSEMIDTLQQIADAARRPSPVVPFATWA